MKAILPVAGLGTRFLPITKSIPKEMLVLIDKPVIQYIVEEVILSGIKEIVLITSRNKRMIEDYFDRNFELEYYLAKAKKKKLLKEIRKISEMANFYFIRQKELMGNGDAILQAKNLIGNEPAAVVFGDDIIEAKVPTLKKMIKIFEKYKDPVIAIKRVPKNEIKNYGSVEVIKLKEKGVYQIKKIIEKPKLSKAPSNFAVVGRYIITPEVIEILENLKPKFKKIKKELGLTDAFQNLLKKNRAIYGYEVEGFRFDCGNKKGLLKAIFYYSKKKTKI
jgi:UTP--glucose-1-phosphate uridylyltransferase